MKRLVLPSSLMLVAALAIAAAFYTFIPMPRASLGTVLVNTLPATATVDAPGVSIKSRPGETHVAIYLDPTNFGNAIVHAFPCDGDVGAWSTSGNIVLFTAVNNGTEPTCHSDLVYVKITDRYGNSRDQQFIADIVIRK